MLDKALHKHTKSFAKKAQHADGLSTVHEAYQFLMKTYPGVQPSMAKTDFSSAKSNISKVQASKMPKTEKTTNQHFKTSKFQKLKNKIRNLKFENPKFQKLEDSETT